MKLNSFKLLLKKNKYIDSLSRIIMYPYFGFMYIKSEHEAKARGAGKYDVSLDWLRGYKNLHKGKRCFIVATGPSLTMSDLELIKDEISFSMNSAVLALEETSWRPEYYLIQDEYVYERMKDAIRDSFGKKLKNIWISENIEQKFGNDFGYSVFPLHYLDHKMFHRKGYGTFKFSDDCYKTIYDGYTVTFSALQIACYMGFSEIYLLGCDCNYNQKKTHFVEYGHKDPKAAIMGDKMIQGHYEFRKFAEKQGVKVINCTRGGMLEVYPRVELECVLKENK